MKLPSFPPPPPYPFQKQEPKQKPKTVSRECVYGIECLKNHFLRAHLYVSEALRCSAGGTVTKEAQEKIRLVREQLLAEDDFQAAIKIGPPLSIEMLKILASARETWKAIEKSGLDVGYGTPDDLNSVASAIKTLYEAIYEVDKRFRNSSSYP